MKTATAKLKSASPYSQSKHYDVPKLDKESAKDYEARTWANRCHVDENGMVYIPPMAFKGCLQEAAKYLAIQIPGKGKATYTKHFEAGVLVTATTPLNIHVDEVDHEWLFVPSDGKPGGGRRVEKCFPLFRSWEGEIPFLIFDETVTKDVFTHILEEAGKFIGIGRFRPRNRGFYGRFEVLGVDWQ